MRKRPSSSVVPVDSLLVPSLRTVTEAPVTMAPFGSLTVPPIAPSVVDCAKAGVQRHANRISGARERCKNFLMEKTPYEFNPEVRRGGFGHGAGRAELRRARACFGPRTGWRGRRTSCFLIMPVEPVL